MVEVIERPWLTQILLNPSPQFFLLLCIEDLGVDCHFLAQEVQKCPDDLLSNRGCGLLKQWMHCPRLRCLAHLVQRRIVDYQQSALLKIRLRDTPTTAQVFVEAVFEQSL